MPELKKAAAVRSRRIRHLGRDSQVLIYLGKFLRMFIYQNDWKVLPMAAVISGLVAMVIRYMLFYTMEGTLMGAFALTCVAIWNGCFNSIQVICRERDVVKREHRAGMHVSSYVAAHLIYQAILCLLQTAITVYVCGLVGVPFPRVGLFTPWMKLDIGITMFLISFASDALSLWVSSLARSTTAAMTVMPFVLIFQLVFSGGMLSLPEWSEPLSRLTISSYGLTALASQADYNNRPLVGAWSSVVSMWDTKVGGPVTVGQILDVMGRDEIPSIHELRGTEFRRSVTVRELLELLKASETSDPADVALLERLLGGALPERYADEPIEVAFTVGETVDYMAEEPSMQGERDRTVNVTATVGEIVELVGKDKAHWEIQQGATRAGFDPNYVNTRGNILSCWAALALLALSGAALTTATLEFIDRDKR